MATAAVAARTASRWHSRGNWSARDDRIPSAVWLGILWCGIISGFALDFPGFLRESPPPPRIVYVHAVVFTAWLVILTAQVLLVLGDRVGWHRKLGWFAAAWAVLLAVIGPWTAMAVQAVDLHATGTLPPQFLAVNFVDLAGFLVLLAWGIRLRSNPAAHRRMMILATVSFADPGFARLAGHFSKLPSHAIPWFFAFFYGNVLLIALMVGWDWWRGRLVRSFALGAAGLLAAEFLAALLYFWGPWQGLTLGWVTAWARFAG